MDGETEVVLFCPVLMDDRVSQTRGECHLFPMDILRFSLSTTPPYSLTGGTVRSVRAGFVSEHMETLWMASSDASSVPDFRAAVTDTPPLERV